MMTVKKVSGKSSCVENVEILTMEVPQTLYVLDFEESMVKKKIFKKKSHQDQQNKFSEN